MLSTQSIALQVCIFLAAVIDYKDGVCWQRNYYRGTWGVFKEFSLRFSSYFQFEGRAEAVPANSGSKARCFWDSADWFREKLGFSIAATSSQRHVEVRMRYCRDRYTTGLHNERPSRGVEAFGPEGVHCRHWRRRRREKNCYPKVSTWICCMEVRKHGAPRNGRNTFRKASWESKLFALLWMKRTLFLLGT